MLNLVNPWQSQPMPKVTVLISKKQLLFLFAQREEFCGLDRSQVILFVHWPMTDQWIRDSFYSGVTLRNEKLYNKL